jgi:hypothetical protein
MFRKALAKSAASRALLPSQRSFLTSAPVRRIVATNPVKAEEVTVRRTLCIGRVSFNFCGFVVMGLGKVPANRP